MKYKMQGTHKSMRGFEYLVYSAFSFVLLTVLVLLPIAPVFASTDTDTTSLEESTSIAETVEEENELPSEITTQDAIDTETVVISSSNEPTEVVGEADIVSEDEALPELSAAEVGDPENLNSETVVQPVGEELSEVLPEEESTVNTDTTDVSTQPVIDQELLVPEQVDGDNTDVIVPDPNTTPTSTTAAPEVETIPSSDTDALPENDMSENREEDTIDESVSSTSVIMVDTNRVDENHLLFSTEECTKTGNDTFYCAKVKESAQVLFIDRVFGAPDQDGDTEIYIEKEGELLQITKNNFEDDAPYFDTISNTIVYHRLLDGRYQVISYNIETEEETQLTRDRYNNMYPNQYDDLVVWQGWVGNDWEVFLSHNGEVSMLTDNTYHDVAPTVNDSHVVWQAFEGTTWVMKIYDIRSKQVETVIGAGESIENPRFVLVYDSKTKEGDVEVKGYDFKSGTVIDLGSRPTPVPSNIPDPDQTGEERALVSTSTQPKLKIDGESDDDIDSDDTASTTSSSDIVIPPLHDTAPDILVTDDLASLDGSFDDVVVTQISSSTQEVSSHIEDIIVTPYTESIQESDPQQAIAPTL